MTDSIANLVDYDAQFEALAARGILFSPEDKKKFRDICDEELKQNDTTGPTSWVYELFAMIQNLFTGKLFEGFDFHNLGDSFSHLGNAASEAWDHTGQQEKLRRLEDAAIHIHDRFLAEGGSFANAAELVSGQHVGALGDNTRPSDMENSIWNQIYSKSITLPPGTSSSLTKVTTTQSETISTANTPTANPQLTRDLPSR